MDDPQDHPPASHPALSLPGRVIGAGVLSRAPIRPIETDRLITLEGTTGIFTPIAKGDGGGVEGDSNLQAIISLLRSEIDDLRTQAATLESERSALGQQVAAVTQSNAQLTARLQEMEALREKVVVLESQNQELRLIIQQPPRMADDFASAVAHSVDSLQTRMVNLTNPISNFAVREFTIDAKVQIDVTPLGTVEYRFIQPGEKVEPSEISNLSLTIVPIPKQDETGTFTRADFTPMTPIDDIQGVGEVYRGKLNEHQIFTVSDLLAAGTRVRGSVALAALLDVDRDRLDEWLSHAQLMTVRDIDGRAAEVLYGIGVRSLADLAAADPAELTARYAARVEQLDRQTLRPIPLSNITLWVQAARAFVGRAPGASTPSS